MRKKLAYVALSSPIHSFLHSDFCAPPHALLVSCYEQLVRLKKRHPERVVLLVGNRDVNKMRLTSELADSELPLHAMARGAVLS